MVNIILEKDLTVSGAENQGGLRHRRNGVAHRAPVQSEVANATLFFDIKDGHRLVDPSGSNCKNDEAAIEKAKVIAIGVSLDKPAVDPTRRISILTADRVKIFTVPVYSKPT
jgi:hypothetical protein